MSKNVIKIVNRSTGREFTDIDHHILSYAKSAPETFTIIYDDAPEVKHETKFDRDSLKAMNMKDLKEIYAIFEEKLGEDVPKARKNSPKEIIEAILEAQEV